MLVRGAAVLEYFGEDEQMSTADFFGTLRRIIVEFKKAAEQVEAIEKAKVSVLCLCLSSAFFDVRI